MKYSSLPKLVPGRSTIGLIAPSGVVEKKGLDAGVKILENWGFTVKLGKHIMAKKADYSAGSEQDRAEDFLEMIADPSVNAIGCIVGGFAAGGLLKLLRAEMFKNLESEPKILFGYSDFSLILNSLFARGFIGFHAPNVGGLASRSLNSQKSLKQALLGEMPMEIGPLANWSGLKPGRAEGRLLVTNLEGLIDLLGTPMDPLANGDEDLILALEEVNENISTLLRWLERLEIHNKAERIKGIILGRFTQMGEVSYPEWGKEMDVEKVFLKIFGDKGIPIASFPEFGHIEEPKGILKSLNGHRRERIDFLSLPCGVKVAYEVKSETCRLQFLEKAVR